MREIFVNKFGRDVKIIGVGEYYATGKKEGIATVVGS